MAWTDHTDHLRGLDAYHFVQAGDLTELAETDFSKLARDPSRDKAHVKPVS